jgi:hypothetical protein
MSELTKESSIQELAAELRSGATGPVRHALWADYPKGWLGNKRKVDNNQKSLAKDKIHSVGDLLTPEGELALYRLEGTGRKSIMAVQSFLAERGPKPDWPLTDGVRRHDQEEATRIRTGRGHGLSLERAIEEADKQYAAKTGKPVGEFSKRIKENTKAQEDGARLKGRRTL